MEIFFTYKTDIAVLLIRVVLGTLFFLQGYDKIFRIGLRQTENAVADELNATKLPGSFIRAVTVFNSFLELGAGLLLIAGWQIYPALTLLSIDLIMVTIAMSLREPLWDMRFVWPRMALVILLLLLPDAWDRISLDYLLHSYAHNQVIP